LTSPCGTAAAPQPLSNASEGRVAELMGNRGTGVGHEQIVMIADTRAASSNILLTPVCYVWRRIHDSGRARGTTGRDHGHHMT